MNLKSTASSTLPDLLTLPAIEMPHHLQNLPVNWHKAASAAIQIELIDYNDLLQFKTEQILGKNSYRIDLLIIKKLTEQPVPKNIAQIFRTFNLFEIKGAYSSLGTDAYYKTIGYAGLFIDQTGSLNQFTANDITLTFLCMRYPRKLIRHLTKDRNLTVAKSSQGIYTVDKETFYSQIIVTGELPVKENLYLRALTDKAPDKSLQNQIAATCIQHAAHPAYRQYLNQFIKTMAKTKGDITMINETVLRLFGTSSKEIEQMVREHDQALHQAEMDRLSSHINYLENLLEQNNIAFDPDIK